MCFAKRHIRNVAEQTHNIVMRHHGGLIAKYS